MKDPKTDIQPAHHLGIGIYTTNRFGVAVDMSRHDFCVISITVLSVATAAATIKLQDSADGVTFADVDGAVFVEPVDAATGETRFLFVRERDVRRHVRMKLEPGAGTTTLSASSMLLNATQPPADVTYSIDTTQ